MNVQGIHEQDLPVMSTNNLDMNVQGIHEQDLPVMSTNNLNMNVQGIHEQDLPVMSTNNLDMNVQGIHEQDWQEPLTFDWSGENGPPFTEEDLYNSEISQIIRNEFVLPWEVKEYVRQKPWWNPRDPRACDKGTARYIPGRQKIPQYPRLSTLTKAQHLSGLKVLSGTYSVPPYNFPSPKQDDYASFDNMKDIYEDEQKEYRLWARQCWVNGDCIRTLQPKPLPEMVYDAQFQLKKNEICALPQEFTMTAQIRLEPREDTSFEFIPLKDLKSVDVNTLPLIDYPDVLQDDISIMKHYVLPVPCHQHPTRFILPHEESVTTLPLPEVNRQLARYANENDATFIASEKALQCLLEYEQVWKLPVYIEAVKCPVGGGVRNVIVLGSKFSLQKECGAQRSFEAFQHLLRHTFTSSEPLTEPLATSSPTHQAGTSNFEHPDQSDCEEASVSDIEHPDQFDDGDASLTSSTWNIEQTDQFDDGDASLTSSTSYIEQTDKFDCGEATLTSSRQEEELKTDVIEGRRSSDSVSYVQYMPRQMPRCSPEPRGPIDDHLSSTDVANESNENVLQIDFNRKRSTEGSCHSNAPSNANCSSETEGLFIDDQQSEVSVPVKHENDLTKAELGWKQHLALIFGSDSEKEPASENSFQSEMDVAVPDDEPASEESFEGEMEVPVSDDEPASEESFKIQSKIEVAVPDEERKRVKVAGICTDIEKDQTSNQISSDTTTLCTKGSPDVGENPTSTKDTDDNNCPCKGTKFEVPPPRSFKKLQVKNATTNRSFDLIVHSSHKVRCGNKEAFLEPVIEWQPELGVGKQAAGRLRALALALVVRPGAVIINVRVDYKNGNMMVIDDRVNEDTFTRWHGDKRSEIADRIYSAIEQLHLLKPGNYILAHNSSHGENAMVYSALAEPAGAGFAGHTISLRPDKDKLSDAQEATIAKNLNFELSRALFPYHKERKILPLAFPFKKNDVKGKKKKVTPAPPAPAPAKRAKKREKKKKQKKKKSKKRRTEQ